MNTPDLVKIITANTQYPEHCALQRLIHTEQKIHERQTYDTGRADLQKTYYLLAAGYVIQQRTVERYLK